MNRKSLTNIKSQRIAENEAFNGCFIYSSQIKKLTEYRKMAAKCYDLNQCFCQSDSNSIVFSYRKLVGLHRLIWRQLQFPAILGFLGNLDFDETKHECWYLENKHFSWMCLWPNFLDPMILAEIKDLGRNTVRIFRLMRIFVACMRSSSDGNFNSSWNAHRIINLTTHKLKASVAQWLENSLAFPRCATRRGTNRLSSTKTISQRYFLGFLLVCAAFALQ